MLPPTKTRSADKQRTVGDDAHIVPFGKCTEQRADVGIRPYNANKNAAPEQSGAAAFLEEITA